LNASALPYLPLLQVVLASVPVFPFPDRSVTVEPVPSSNAYAATSPVVDCAATGVVPIPTAVQNVSATGRVSRAKFISGLPRYDKKRWRVLETHRLRYLGDSIFREEVILIE
jgi:hypothetical protein